MSRILVVDDDPGLRQLLTAVLELAGHQVVEAPHGAAALELIQASPLPNLILTDLMMPVMGGFELIRQLRSDPRTAAIPIIVVSGNAEAGDGAESPVEADARVLKPFVPRELVSLVHSLRDRVHLPRVLTPEESPSC